MYCPNCGKKCTDEAKYCRYCGTALEKGKRADQALPGDPVPADAGEETPQETPRKYLWIIWIVIAAAVCAVVVVVLVLVFGGGRENRTSEYATHMETGYAYMEDGEYEEAVAQFKAAIEIEPDEIEAYRSLADAYEEMGETDTAEETYDDARDVIVGSFEEDESLPDGSRDLYEGAITYYGEKGDSDQVGELADEITDMLPDEDDREAIAQIRERYETDTGETEETEETEVAVLSADNVEGLLSTFSFWAQDMLESCYTTDADGDPEILSDYETVSAPEVYTVSAFALRQDTDASEGETYYSVDGTLYSQDEYSALGDAQKESAGTYLLLSAANYEEYIRDLFGEEYSLDDFAKYQDEIGDAVIMDDAGEFYVSAEDYASDVVDLAIVDISETPDEEGAYTVTAEYTAHWNGSDTGNYYMEYRIAPDPESSYECRLVGMAPAGGVVSEEISVSQPEEESVNADTEAEKEEEPAQEAATEQEVRQLSLSEIKQGALDLYNRLVEYSATDSAKFADLIVGASDAEVMACQDEFSQIYAAHYDRQLAVVVRAISPYCFVQYCSYSVDGTYPNERMSEANTYFILSYDGNDWKVDYSQEAYNTIGSSDNMSSAYPDGWNSARQAGRNAAVFGPFYIGLDSSAVFEGTFHSELFYMWQNADGSADAVVWFGNGTNTAITVNEIFLTVTDSNLGTVVEVGGLGNYTINAGCGTLVDFHIDAESVQTGTQTWGSLSSSVNTIQTP